MKVVIFGAGASFDSINRYHDEGAREIQWQPPLGNDIFGHRRQFREIISKYPGAESLGNEILSASDIEEFLQYKFDFLEKTNDPITFAQLVNCRYYFSELFRDISYEYSKDLGISNYNLLIKKAHEYSLLNKEEVCFITFNYDLLLEKELKQLYCPKSSSFDMEKYISYPIKLFKPHGSCNWFKCIKPGIVRDGVNPSNNFWEDQLEIKEFNEAIKNDIVIDNIAFTILTHENKPSFRGKDSEYLPQLLVPIKKKDEIMMPANHLTKMKSMLEEATDILIIGWKGNEDSFNKLLKDSVGDKKINFELVVKQDTIQTLEDNLREFFPNSNIKQYKLSYAESKRQRDDSYKTILHKDEGTFSSFMLNWYKNKDTVYGKYFFDIQ